MVRQGKSMRGDRDRDDALVRRQSGGSQLEGSPDR